MCSSWWSGLKTGQHPPFPICCICSWEASALKRLCQQGKLVSALSNVKIIFVLWHKASYFVAPLMYVFIWDPGKEQVNEEMQVCFRSSLSAFQRQGSCTSFQYQPCSFSFSFWHLTSIFCFRTAFPRCCEVPSDASFGNCHAYLLVQSYDNK